MAAVEYGLRKEVMESNELQMSYEHPRLKVQRSALKLKGHLAQP